MTTTTDRTGDDIAAALRMIRTSWDQMIPTLRSPQHGHITGTRQCPTPVPVPVVSLRYEVDATQAALARLVIVGRRLVTRPASAETCVVAGFLMVHADWLAHQDTGMKAAADLTKASKACHAIATSRRTRSVPVGDCPRYVSSDDPDEHTPCPGRLSARFRDMDDAEDMLPAVVSCTADPSHTWQPWQWVALGRQVKYGTAA